MSDYLDPANEELFKDFLIEAEMQVETMECNILAIENDRRDCGSVDELFRAVHALKGAAYTVQMNELALLTRKVEDLLSEVRNDKLEMNPIIVNLLLNSIDTVKEMLEERIMGRIYAKNIHSMEEQLVAWTKGIGGAATTKMVSETEFPQDIEAETNAGKLASETVIDKTAFHKINSQLAELVSEMHSTHFAVREQLNMMTEELLCNSSPKERNADTEGQNTAAHSPHKTLHDQASQIHALLEPLENRLKTIITQFGNLAADLA